MAARKKPPADPMQDGPPPDPHAGARDVAGGPDPDLVAAGKCGAKCKQSEGYCKHPAGFRTDNPHALRCWLHGGSTPSKHGRYSTLKNATLADLMEELAHDPDPFDLTPEVLMLRALVQDYVDRHIELSEALIEWHESWKEGTRGGKPYCPPDIIAVGALIGQIGSMVDRIQKAKASGSVSLTDVNDWMSRIGAAVVQAAQEKIRDAAERAALLGALESRWAAIPLGERSGDPRSAGGAS